MALDLWTRFDQPPPSALKTIGAGRLRGKSDINPQWRYRALTDVFGPCGFGWRYTIDRLWLEHGSSNEIFAFAQVSLYVHMDGQWSEAIPGIGGHKLVIAEREGLHNNDEAFKMATTDALGVAAKMLGVAADVYLGNWDGSKYREDDARPPATQPPASPPTRGAFANPPPKQAHPPAPTKWSDMTSEQRKNYTLGRIAVVRGLSDPHAALAQLNDISAKLGKMPHSDLTEGDRNAVIEALLKAEQDITAEGSGQ